jgi:predicted alpha/beta-fold hydrolase
LAPQICKAAAVSTPCDLASSASKLAKPANFIYMNRFIHAFRRKVRAKKKVMPDKIDDRGFYKIRTFKHYDDRYTAPQNGFRTAEDYWAQASAKPFLLHIHIPTLIINAQDDPMLDWASFPIEEARQNPNLFLEMPKYGGHTGFIQSDNNGEYWHETRITEFVLEHNERGVLS